MKELGRKGGRRNGKIKPERVHEGLREYLKREVAPSEVWAALKLAMEGQNESARVSASRVLMDALSEPGGADCQACARRKAEMPAVRARLDRILENRAAAVAEARRDEELAALAPVIQYLAQEYAATWRVPSDVSPEMAAEVIQGLEEVGLLVSLSKVEERAEEIAQERLAALKAEHALTV
jgi:hypothetical protein